jgi:hypothetical protein
VMKWAARGLQASSIDNISRCGTSSRAEQATTAAEFVL